MSELAKHLDSPAPAIWLEVSPPAGIAIEPAVERLARARGLVDAINVTDNAMGRARMSALVFGMAVRNRLGIPIVMNMSCRDRNLLALRSELIGAAAAGIEGIVALRGDTLAPGAGASVNEIDPPGLIREVEKLNRRRGAALMPGAVSNPHRRDFAREVELLRRRAEAGARFVITQPVFEPESAIRIADAARAAGVAPMIGILPIRSAAMARSIGARIKELGPARNEIDRYLGMDDHDARRVTIARSLALTDTIRGRAAGFVLMSGGDPSLAIELAELLRSRILATKPAEGHEGAEAAASVSARVPS
jgi:5,10-methylenetetrahydrofolate reductase